MKQLFSLLAAMLAIPLSYGAELPDSLIGRYAARMVMIGFRGDSVETDSDIRSILTEMRPGGIILFDVDLTSGGGPGTRNIRSRAQVTHLTRTLQRTAHDPLFIAVDQEGGKVQRLKPQYGFSALPSPKKLGDIDHPDTTRRYSAIAASELHEAGINMNLAPELDLHKDGCPVIGALDRAYSSNPEKVAAHAATAIRSARERGIVSVGKHFPGHGSASADSHYGLTDVTATWDSTELVPFEYLIREGLLDAVMTAHIFNRNIDPDYPATLSRKTITGLLRDNMGYDGLVITDDLYMKGIIDNYPVEEAVIMAINAGADMLIVGNNINTGYEPDRLRKIVDIITRAVKTGRIPRQRLLESNARIVRALQTKKPAQ